LADVAVIGVQYRPDQVFPEHNCFWDAAQYPSYCPTPDPLGGTVHVFLRNNGTASVTMQDVVFAGESLAEILVLHYQVAKRQPASIWLDGLTSARLNNLLSAGEPVWYKMDPGTIAPGATAQVVVRVRQTPQLPSINIDVVHNEGITSASVPIDPTQPSIASVGFSSDLTKVYIYWRRATGSAAPATVLLDGNDVTTRTTTSSDAALAVAVSVLQLAQPLEIASFHTFQGVYADGASTTAGLRAWVNKFIYGTWGAQPGNDGDYAAARAWIDDAANHSVNALVVNLGSSALGDYLKTAAGRQYAADRDYGFVIDSIGKWACSNPLLWFIRDEPDAADWLVADIPGNKKVGSLAQMAVGTGETLRAANPSSPTVLNLDLTYKPFNWYNYGQVADVTMSDPYYQPRLREAYWGATSEIPLYSKATFVYAVSQLAQSAAEPNPLHIILYSCEYIDTGSGQTFPFPTPECKRIEVYYALAGGAKGISYWWYLKSNSAANGLADGGTEARALWKEIGLLGAEVGIAAPLLVAGCPAALPLQPANGVWARSLLVGSDTVILLAVNDQYYNDASGCHYTPVAAASVGVTLPAWMTSPSAFEISAAGIRDVATQQNGNQLQVSLGTLNITRMIVLTSNAQLRSTIQQRYTQTYRARVCAIASDVCAATPPTITQQPQSQTVAEGHSATFTVVASSTAALTYKWQKNQADLADGGHYSGTTTTSLAIASVDSTDVASYRCVVTNTYGSTTSSEASLTLLGPPGDFDGDGDVDQEDFGFFQHCLSGYAIPFAAGCDAADLQQDNDVDLDDFIIFQRCFAGPDVSASPDCAD
jgi:hypothetical protein